MKMEHTGECTYEMGCFWDVGAVMDACDGRRSGGKQGKKPKRSDM